VRVLKAVAHVFVDLGDAPRVLEEFVTVDHQLDHALPFGSAALGSVGHDRHSIVPGLWHINVCFPKKFLLGKIRTFLNGIRHSLPAWSLLGFLSAWVDRSVWEMPILICPAQAYQLVAFSRKCFSQYCSGTPRRTLQISR
jgi:hypothetical protein